MAECPACVSGTAASEPGSVKCLPCSPGSWNKNSSACVLCDDGCVVSDKSLRIELMNATGTLAIHPARLFVPNVQKDY